MEKIGVATIEYNGKGAVVRANFQPIKKFEVDLSQLKGNEDEKTVRDNAELIMASWFSKVNEIELADRDKFKIESKVLDCRKWPDGTIKKCWIEFYLKEI